MNTQQFISTLGPLATKDMRTSGILASITMAQAILESGWGTSELAVNANNYFGMKKNLPAIHGLIVHVTANQFIKYLPQSKNLMAKFIRLKHILENTQIY